MNTVELTKNAAGETKHQFLVIEVYGPDSRICGIAAIALTVQGWRIQEPTGGSKVLGRAAMGEGRILVEKLEELGHTVWGANVVIGTVMDDCGTGGTSTFRSACIEK